MNDTPGISLLPPLDNTSTALEPRREFSEFLGTYAECEQVRDFARDCGYTVPNLPIQRYTRKKCGVMIECSDEALADLAEVALAARIAA